MISSILPIFTKNIRFFICLFCLQLPKVWKKTRECICQKPLVLLEHSPCFRLLICCFLWKATDFFIFCTGFSLKYTKCIYLPVYLFTFVRDYRIINITFMITRSDMHLSYLIAYQHKNISEHQSLLYDVHLLDVSQKGRVASWIC